MSNDNEKIKRLYSHVEDMLYDYGFSSDLYLIVKQTDSIDVEFDDKGAVIYFQKQADKEYPSMLYVEYIRNRKRHIARVQYW